MLDGGESGGKQNKNVTISQKLSFASKFLIEQMFLNTMIWPLFLFLSSSAPRLRFNASQ